VRCMHVRAFVDMCVCVCVWGGGVFARLLFVADVGILPHTSTLTFPSAPVRYRMMCDEGLGDTQSNSPTHRPPTRLGERPPIRLGGGSPVRLGNGGGGNSSSGLGGGGSHSMGRSNIQPVITPVQSNFRTSRSQSGSRMKMSGIFGGLDNEEEDTLLVELDQTMPGPDMQGMGMDRDAGRGFGMDRNMGGGSGGGSGMPFSTDPLQQWNTPQRGAEHGWSQQEEQFRAPEQFQSASVSVDQSRRYLCMNPPKRLCRPHAMPRIPHTPHLDGWSHLHSRIPTRTLLNTRVLISLSPLSRMSADGTSVHSQHSRLLPPNTEGSMGPAP
jgi:hypothetical protein